MDGIELFTATDREECGVILGVVEDGIRRATKVVKVRNHARRKDDYAIKAKDFVRVLDANKDLTFIGFFHTHLPDHDPLPSDRDFQGARIVEGLNCVYHPASNTFTWYTSRSIVEDPQQQT